MRKRCVTAALAVLVAAGCGSAAGTSDDAVEVTPPAEPTTDPAPDLLFLGSGSGVTVFDADASRVTVDAPGGVPSQQGNAVVHSVPRGEGTEVVALEPETGDVRWSQLLAEPVELRLASADGTAAVLGPIRPTDGTIAGREQTVLTVVRGDDERRDYSLAGNFEPETFSLDASKLFLIEYLPPLAPEQYTLKLLDLVTGDLTEVFDAHGGKREPMRGTARTQVYSADGKRLYTYYQIVGEPYVEHPGHDPIMAFVHVLDLVEGWAHCVDLPLPFGTSAEINPALAVAPDGGEIYVADPALGLLAEADTDTLKVTRTAQIAPAGPPVTSAATISDGSLWLAFDNTVHDVDLGSLHVTASFDAPDQVSALRHDRARARLFVALPTRVAVIDPRTGRALTEVLPDTGPFTSADPSEGTIVGPRDVVKCAC